VAGEHAATERCLGYGGPVAEVRTRPLPFPPEPLRSPVIHLTRNRLAAADRREGRRGYGSARSIASGSGSAAEATAAGSAAKLAVTGGAPRTGDVTAGGENRN
jgi:hypothetical protein